MLFLPILKRFKGMFYFCYFFEIIFRNWLKSKLGCCFVLLGFVSLK